MKLERRPLLLLFTLIIYAIVSVLSSSVIDASDETFDEITVGYESLVELYAPWCFACQRFSKEYELVAKKLSETRPHIRVLRIDITVNRGAVMRFFPSGVPALFHVTKEGVVREINSQLEVDAVSNAILPDSLQNITPFTAWRSPYSFFGRARGYTGRAVGYFLDVIEAIRVLSKIYVYSGFFSFSIISILGYFSYRFLLKNKNKKCSDDTPKIIEKVKRNRRSKSQIRKEAKNRTINELINTEENLEEKEYLTRKRKKSSTRSQSSSRKYTSDVESELLYNNESTKDLLKKSNLSFNEGVGEEEISILPQQNTPPPLRRSTRISKSGNV